MVLVRHHARIATLRATAEYRIARASHARNTPTEIKQVGEMVDMYRRPTAKDLPGWRGPCLVMDLDIAGGVATVKWQGRPWLVSLRHIRPYRGFVAPLVAHGSRVLHAFADERAREEHEMTVTILYTGGATDGTTNELAFTGSLPLRAHGSPLKANSFVVPSVAPSV